MYAAGTGGLASSGGAIWRPTGTSSRCQQSRSHAATVAMTRPTGDRRFTCGMRQGRKAAMPVRPTAARPARGGPSPSPVSPGRTAATLSRRRCCATRKSFFIRSSCCTCGSRSSSMLVIVVANLSPASVADAFGDGLFRSVPEASRHQRRHDGNAGHNEPVRNGRDSNRKSCKAHHNHPPNEKQRLGIFGDHEPSVATGCTGPLFRIARCPDQSRRLAARTCLTSNP